MDNTYTTKEVAGFLKVTINTIKIWLKNGKLKGVKSGKSWYITKDNLKEAFPEWAFGAFANTTEENMQKKLIIKVFDNEELYRELYPKKYEQELECDRQLDEMIDKEYWKNRFLEEPRERMGIRYPIPDGILEDTDAEPEVAWERYYQEKLKEEKVKLSKLLELLKNKYNMKDIAEEIERTADNIKVIELAGIRDN